MSVQAVGKMYCFEGAGEKSCGEVTVSVLLDPVVVNENWKARVITEPVPIERKSPAQKIKQGIEVAEDAIRTGLKDASTTLESKIEPIRQKTSELWENAEHAVVDKASELIHEVDDKASKLLHEANATATKIADAVPKTVKEEEIITKPTEPVIVVEPVTRPVVEPITKVHTAHQVGFLDTLNTVVAAPVFVVELVFSFLMRIFGLSKAV